MKKDKYNWGIIGYGDVVERKFMPSITKSTHSKVISVLGRDKNRLNRFAKKYDIENFYTNIKDFLDDDKDWTYIDKAPYKYK